MEENQINGAAISTGQVNKIEPGHPVEMVNAATDVPTVIADGFNSISVSPSVTRIQFIEHIALGENVHGRHVINLAIPNDQLEVIAKTLGEVGAKLAEARAAKAQ